MSASAAAMHAHWSRHEWVSRARHHRLERPVSLADCLLLACVGGDDALATADAHVAAVARAESLVVRTLPDSTGHRP